MINSCASSYPKATPVVLKENNKAARGEVGFEIACVVARFALNLFILAGAIALTVVGAMTGVPVMYISGGVLLGLIFLGAVCRR